jgi:hypothetical protein
VPPEFNPQAVKYPEKLALTFSKAVDSFLPHFPIQFVRANRLFHSPPEALSC